MSKTEQPVTCVVCGSKNVKVEAITSTGKWPVKPKSLEFHFCGDCGHCGIPGNAGGFETAETFSKGSKPSSDPNARVGDGSRPGREYFMMKTAAEILGRGKLDVLFYGAGLSRDFELASKLDNVRSVALTDVADFMKSDHFIPMDAQRKFDVVIACEVVEHFTDPHANFQNLFGFMKEDGIIICSTNIHNGGGVAKLKYPYIKGHVAYYSGGAIRHIAERNGLEFDFRVPACINGIGGPRKRYILFYKNPSYRKNVAEFFATHPYAFSE